MGVIVRWRWMLIGRWVFGRGMESWRGVGVVGVMGAVEEERPLGRGLADMSGWVGTVGVG